MPIIFDDLTATPLPQAPLVLGPPSIPPSSRPVLALVLMSALIHIDASNNTVRLLDNLIVSPPDLLLQSLSSSLSPQAFSNAFVNEREVAYTTKIAIRGRSLEPQVAAQVGKKIAELRSTALSSFSSSSSSTSSALRVVPLSVRIRDTHFTDVLTIDISVLHLPHSSVLDIAASLVLEHRLPAVFGPAISSAIIDYLECVVGGERNGKMQILPAGEALRMGTGGKAKVEHLEEKDVEAFETLCKQKFRPARVGN